MGYAAFISYSSSADRHRARQLRHALHRFARPWKRVRALRVFLDHAALSADPRLWSRLEQALGASEYFILLASPESARSHWVNQEVSWWRQGPRKSNLLLVVTGGELHWDRAAGDFDWNRTTCLPRALRAHFSEEPRWLDLRWMGEDQPDDPRDPRFQDCVADLAATLHDRPKDELIGEDVTQRRKLRNFRWIMQGLAITLGLALVAATVIALVQRNTAQAQARLATARELAATAMNLRDDDLEVASLLALQAYQVQETPETLSALSQLTVHSPRLVRFVRGEGTVTALALTTSARYVAAGTDRGVVTVWTSDGRRTVERISVKGEVSALEFSEDDQLLAIGTGSGETAVHDLRAGDTRRLSAGKGPVDAVAFRPSSHDLAANGGGTLRLYRAGDGEPHAQVVTGLRAGVLNLAFRDKGRELAVVTALGWRVYDDSLRRTRSSDDTLYPHNGYVSAASPSGNCFGYSRFGAVQLESVAQLLRGRSPGDTSGEDGCGAQPVLPGKQSSSLAVSDGDRVAVGTSQGLFLATAQGDPERPVIDTLPGVETPSVLAFSPGAGDRLASAGGSTVALWNLAGKTAPTMHRLGVRVPDGATVPSRLPLAMTPDGHIAWSHEWDAGVPSTLDLRPPKGKDMSAGGRTFYEGLAFAQSGDTLYAASRNAVEAWTWREGSLQGERVFALPAGTDTISVPPRIATRPDGGVVVVVSDGSVLLHDSGTGELSTAVERPAPRPTERDRRTTGLTEYRTAVSEKGALAAVATTDGRVDVYELPSGRRVHRLDLGGGSLDALALSERTDSLFAVTDGRLLQRWDVSTGRLRWRSDGAGPVVVAADPGGRWAATLAGDGTVWLWDAESGDRLVSTALPVPRSYGGAEGHGAQSNLVFAPDGKRLWSITEGGEVLSWDTSVTTWIRQLCDRVGRRLTEAERARYLTAVSRGHTACGAYPDRTSGTP
ncbi:TIR domain-containing protein [Streptomyces sp. F63]|uniref:toll/interleukin-1 receptor domain-containing protein n=1 Tax=Streptomyces sp. F63 TaxID=2824887 RepID=UPI001B368085|nr:TIR domain-containing protein [Streptomyces sp. F63]MBQ0984693.1 TIR domain-containing protein [Streptomyces sp. F63]